MFTVSAPIVLDNPFESRRSFASTAFREETPGADDSQHYAAWLAAESAAQNPTPADIAASIEIAIRILNKAQSDLDAMNLVTIADRLDAITDGVWDVRRRIAPTAA